METIDLRRVTEIHFHRSLLQLCVNRGTVRPWASCCGFKVLRSLRLEPLPFASRQDAPADCLSRLANPYGQFLPVSDCLQAADHGLG